MIEMNNETTVNEAIEAVLPTASQEVQEVLENYFQNFDDAEAEDFSEFAGVESTFEEGDNMHADIAAILEKYNLNPEEYSFSWEITAKVIKL